MRSSELVLDRLADVRGLERVRAGEVRHGVDATGDIEVGGVALTLTLKRLG